MSKLLKLSSLMLVVALAVFLFTACGGKTPAAGPEGQAGGEQIQNSDQSDQTGSKEIFTISAIGLEDPEIMVKNFKPLCDYLSEKINMEVRFKPAPTYENAVQWLRDGTIDMASLGPVTYVQAHDGFGGEAIVKALEGGEAFYESVIFVRKDSLISKLEDMKGKKMAFGDKDSCSSNLSPKYLYSKVGIFEKDFAEAKNITSQNDVIQAVISGEFHAGAVKAHVFDKHKNEGVGLKEIARKTEIPTFPYTIRPGMDAQVKEKLKNALLEVDEELAKTIEPKYTGFTDVSDEDYQWIREAMQMLGIK